MAPCVCNDPVCVCNDRGVRSERRHDLPRSSCPLASVQLSHTRRSSRSFPPVGSRAEHDRLPHADRLKSRRQCSRETSRWHFATVETRCNRVAKPPRSARTAVPERLRRSRVAFETPAARVRHRRVYAWRLSHVRAGRLAVRARRPRGTCETTAVRVRRPRGTCETLERARKTIGGAFETIARAFNARPANGCTCAVSGFRTGRKASFLREKRDGNTAAVTAP
jgi:hypothetical protein